MSGSPVFTTLGGKTVVAGVAATGFDPLQDFPEPLAYASMLWPASALQAPFSTGSGIKRITIHELAEMGWVEAIDPGVVDATEHGPGKQGGRLRRTAALTSAGEPRGFLRAARSPAPTNRDVISPRPLRPASRLTSPVTMDRCVAR